MAGLNHKYLRIGERVIWSASDDTGHKHDLHARVLKITDKRVCIGVMPDNSVHTVSPQNVRTCCQTCGYPSYHANHSGDSGHDYKSRHEVCDEECAAVTKIWYSQKPLTTDAAQAKRDQEDNRHLPIGVAACRED